MNAEPTKTSEHLTVSIRKACDLTGVSRRTIYNWLEQGRIAYVRTAGGNVRIVEDTLWRSGGAREPAGAGPYRRLTPVKTTAQV